MPDRRKPPADSGSRPGSRPDGAPLPSDSGGFSIETTTMRLKSLRLRRADVENKGGRTSAVKAAIHKDSVEMPRRRTFGPRASRRARRGGLGLGGCHGRIRHAEHHARAQETRGRRSQDRRSQTRPSSSSKPPGATRRGGFDPYNQRGTGKRQGEAAQRAGITGSADRDRGSRARSAHGQEEVVCGAKAPPQAQPAFSYSARAVYLTALCVVTLSP